MNTKFFIMFCVFFGMLNFAFADENGSDKATLIIMYDSQIHELTNVPSIFFVSKIDVSESSRIEASINTRLQYGGKGKSTEEVEKWARKKIQTDPQIKNLIGKIPASLSFLNHVNDIGITKVPAVVLRDGDQDFVVYGQTDIRKAVQAINSYRVGSSG